LLGEISGPGCLTLRTSIIGRELGTTSGLVEWFISQRGKAARGYARAIYTGFTTLELANIIARVLVARPDLSGLWQASSTPISKFDLLQLINREMNLGVDLQRDEALVCDRSLCSDRFRRETGYTPPSWPEMIRQMVQDPTPYPLIRKEHAC
jgi:dTDP-4-dehydrorhamnose reductase